jgi:uncharacterized protein YicC (UPF0701 family)
VSELTKEYFDQHLKAINTRMDGLATKEDLKPLATKHDVREGVEELARIIANTVANPMEERFAKLESRIDVTERVQHLETDMQKIKEALHIR